MEYTQICLELETVKFGDLRKLQISLMLPGSIFSGREHCKKRFPCNHSRLCMFVIVHSDSTTSMDSAAVFKVGMNKLSLMRITRFPSVTSKFVTD